MKYTITSIIAALALPTLAGAQDPAAPNPAPSHGDAGIRVPEKNTQTAIDAAQGDGAATGQATSEGKGKAGKMKAGKENHFSGKITAVDRDAKTVTVGDRVVKVGDSSKITAGKKTAGWDELTVGTQVHGTLTGEGDSATVEMLSINKK